MKIKASGCAALILAAGLFACVAAPSTAAAGTDRSKWIKHHRHYAQDSSGKAAVKSSDSESEPAVTGENGELNPAALPPLVANANAQLAAANLPAESARAMTTRANDIVQAAADESQVVASDQLNDVDRALHDDTPRQTTLAMASAEAPGATARPVTAGSESTSSDQASLIGKIFIACGALLTLASAARLFLA
jgi:hypothetical protein